MDADTACGTAVMAAYFLAIFIAAIHIKRRGYAR